MLASERLVLGQSANSSVSLVLDPRVGGQIVEKPSIDAMRLLPGLTWPAFLPADNTAGSAAFELQAASLEQLLRARHNVFWSHVIHDRGLAIFLDSYLRYCARSYDAEFVVYSGMDLRSAVFERVFKMLLRAGTPRESKDFLLDTSYHEKWLQSEHSWFNVPRILDMCALYRAVNRKSLASVVTVVFASCPRLYADVQKAAVVIVTTVEKSFAPKKTSPQAARDRELFLLDSLANIYSLLAVFPRSAKQLQMAGVEPFIGRYFAQYRLVLSSLAGSRRGQVDRLAASVMWTVVDVCYLDRLYEKGTNKYSPAAGKALVELLSGLDRELMDSMESQHNLAETLRKILARGGSELPRKDLEKIAARLDLDSTVVVEELKDGKVSFNELAVCQVLDVLPDLGRSFVETCITFMDGNAESVINALLTDSLPGPLAALDRVTGLAAAAPDASVSMRAGGKGKEEEEEEDVRTVAESMTPCMMEEIAEERGEVPSGTGAQRLQIGKRSLATELPQVDHEMRAFISRYVDAYDDEYDDSFAVHADLAMEPLGEDEAEAQDSVPLSAPMQTTESTGEAAGRGRGRGVGGGGGKKGKVSAAQRSSSKRKQGNMKKSGMMQNLK